MTSAASPVHEGFITTGDGIRLFFRQVGSGSTPVVIPNGFHLFEDFQRFAAGRKLIFYDVRNRGWSDTITDETKLERGIQNDVEDLDAIRRHFGIERLNLIGHSYVGLMVALYVMKHPATVDRALLIGPMQPDASRQYPAHLTATDNTLADVFSKLARMQKERMSADPVEACRAIWAVLCRIYVTDAADADKIKWDRCELANERNFMKYWTAKILPSIQKLHFSPDQFANVAAPVLIIHGTRDRSSPYGGGRDWASMFPDARLVTVENAAHAPWIEAPDLVFGAIDRFFAGGWPEQAEKVTPQIAGSSR